MGATSKLPCGPCPLLLLEELELELLDDEELLLDEEELELLLELLELELLELELLELELLPAFWPPQAVSTTEASRALAKSFMLFTKSPRLLS